MKQSSLYRSPHPSGLSAAQISSMWAGEKIIPICAGCHNIRMKGTKPSLQESWVTINFDPQKEIAKQFSHGLCPRCLKKLYPDYVINS